MNSLIIPYANTYRYFKSTKIILNKQIGKAKIVWLDVDLFVYYVCSWRKKEKNLQSQ